MDPQVTVKENGDFRRIYRKGRSAVSGAAVPSRRTACRTGAPGHRHGQPAQIALTAAWG